MPHERFNASVLISVFLCAWVWGCGGSSDSTTANGSGGSANGAGQGGQSSNTGSAGTAAGGNAGAGIDPNAPFGFAGAEVVAAAQAWPVRVVADGEFVYWVNYGINSQPGSVGDIQRMPTGGGSAESLLAGQVPGPAGIAVDADNIYFPSTEGGIFVLPKTGGAVTPLSTELEATGIVGFARAGQWLFWGSVLDSIGATSIDGAVTKSIQENVAVPYRVAVGRDNVYFISNGLEGAMNGQIIKTDLAGDSPEVLVDGLALPEGAVEHQGALYYAESELGQVHRLDLSTKVDDVIAELSMQPWALAADSRYLYVSERGSVSSECDLAEGRVVAIPHTGGEPLEVAAGLICPSTLAVTDRALFWVTNGLFDDATGTLMRALKDFE